MSEHPKASYAGFWRRFAAFNIDTTLVGIITVGVRMLTGANPFVEAIPQQSVLQYFLARIVVPYVIGMAVTVLFWVRSGGRSPGKWMMHIRIVKAHDQPLGVFSAVLRYIGYSISSVFLNFGYLLMLIDAEKQTVHDKIAKTHVILDGTKKPSVLSYLVGFLGPIVMLALYSWLMLVSHGLAVVPSDLRARVKDFQSAAKLRQTKPEVQVHLDKAQEYIDQLPTIDAKLPDYTDQVRTVARQAVEELKLARDLDPQNGLIHIKFNNAYVWLDGEPALEKAYESAMTAHRLDPEDRHYAYVVANTLVRMERYEEAVAMYEKAISLDHTFAAAYRGLGVAYQYLNVNDKAKENYEKAIEFYTKTNEAGKNDGEIEVIRGYIANLPK